MKNQFITAYCWMYGATKREAAKAWARADKERRELIIAAFQENAKKSFNAD